MSALCQPLVMWSDILSGWHSDKTGFTSLGSHSNMFPGRSGQSDDWHLV